MSNDSTNITSLALGNLQGIQKGEVRKISIDIDSETGEETTEINLKNGRTIIDRKSPSGIQERSYTQVPEFSTIDERDQAVKEEMKIRGNTQNKVARKLNISQPLVSKILKADK